MAAQLSATTDAIAQQDPIAEQLMASQLGCHTKENQHSTNLECGITIKDKNGISNPGLYLKIGNKFHFLRFF
ncbi:hypothetical protein K2X05_08300 [bacterium]|nr:hypothetical protein [bacterium]